MNISCYASGVIENGILNVNGENFKIKGTSDKGKGIWKFVPLTDSSGIVSSISNVERVKENSKSTCTGRVTQVSRQGTALVKISDKCKITVCSNIILQVNKLYEFELELLDGKLQVVCANGEEPPAATARPAKQQSNVSLDEVHIENLELEICNQYPSIQLNQPVIYSDIVEWEGTVDGTKIRIHGNLKSTKLSFFEFNEPPSGSDNHPDTLKVTPLGAARSIGASCFKVEIGNYEIVLDAGTRPKGSNPLPAFDQLTNPNLILITHAHQDHIGALPVLHQMFPATPMICTPGTREIAKIMLADCLKIQQNEDFQPLFDENDLQNTLLHLDTRPIGTEFEPLPGLKVKFINAGHIVGAACIYLELGDRSLLYTGDYNVANTRTTEGLKIEELPKADMLITEATYGASLHANRKQQETDLVNAVTQVVIKGGNALIPAFALGRAQEIILALKTSAFFSQTNVPIYVDGLVRAVTDTFADNLELLPQAVRNLATQSRTMPFTDNVRVIPIGDYTERPLAIAKPSVIIASSGMLTGGPSVYYAKALLERDNAAIFISGYTDEESPGRLLQEMKQGEVVEIEGQSYTVKAQVKRFNLSAHTDRAGIGGVVAKVAPRHLILIHGSPEALHDIAKSDFQKHHIIHIPHVGQTVEYGIVPDFVGEGKKIELIHPKEIELEIVSEHDGAWIRVPKEVVDTDPRWEWLSKFGVVKAKWHNSSLVFKPITNNSLVLNKAKESLQKCCAKCEYLSRAGVCECDQSSMFGFDVDPNGVCEEFLGTSS